MDTAGRHPLQGVLLIVLGVFLFACMDTAIKHLSARHPAPLIVALRYIVHCLLMVAVLAPSHGRRLVQTSRTGLVMVRAGCLVVASLLFALALKRMPVAESTAILFVGPVLVMLMAGPFLSEQVGPFEWLAAGLGFAGVLVIGRPGSGLDAAGVALALGAATLTATYQLLSRVLARTETTIAMLFLTALAGALVFGAALPWFWDGRIPSALDLALFLGIGAAGGVGHFLFTAAHRLAPASTIAPLLYAQLLWAGLLGWLVFGQAPDGLGILGMAMVTVAGLLVATKSQLARAAMRFTAPRPSREA